MLPTRLPAKHIILSLLFITVLIGAWYAYKQTSNAFAAEGLDLVIDNTSYYNGAISPTTTWEFSDLDDGNGPSLGQYLFFNFSDVKPGDFGEDTIGLQVLGSDYYACVDLSLTSDDDTSSNEPELATGDLPDNPLDLFDGELGEAINFLFWIDDGDNVFEDNETILEEGNAKTVLDSQWTLADSNSNIFSGASDPLLAGSNYYIGKAWCFGTLAQTPLVQDNSSTERTPIDSEGPGVTCSGEAEPNQTQTDSLTADIEFLSVQAEDNPDYSCGDCSISGTFGADSSVEYIQGLKKNGSPVDPARTNPSTALGTPEGTNAIGTFVSLGFGGSLTLKFNSAVVNVPGNDIAIHEVTNGIYPLEIAKVEVSQNGSSWQTFVAPASNQPTPVSNFDLDELGLSWIKYIRLTDTSNPGLHNATADGFDVDGIIVHTVDVCVGS